MTCDHPEVRCEACDESMRDFIDRALTAEIAVSNQKASLEIMGREMASLRGDRDALQVGYDLVCKERDQEMERVKACEHIAEGEPGWEKLSNLCPSTAAVTTLRECYVDAKSKLASMSKALEREMEAHREIASRWESTDKAHAEALKKADYWFVQAEKYNAKHQAADEENANLILVQQAYDNSCRMYRVQVATLQAKIMEMEKNVVKG